MNSSVNSTRSVAVISSPDPLPSVKKVLLIGQDNLFETHKNLLVDFLPTGKAYTPDAPVHARTFAPIKGASLLRSYFSGSYDLAIFPAVDLFGTYGDSPPQLSFRHLLRWVCRFGNAIKRIQRWRPMHTRVVMLDRYDHPEIHNSMASLLKINSYWKLNLDAQHAGSSAYDIRSLPCWVYPPAYGLNNLPWEEKDIDLFCAFSVNSEAKRRALEWATRLDAKELRIFIANERLDNDTYHQCLSRSRLVLSPEGIGYHCFRHYQAMMHGAVPVTDRPTTTVTDLQHGENCLFFNPDEACFQAVIHEAIKDDGALQKLAARSRNHWQSHHTPQAVGDKILNSMTDIHHGSDEPMPPTGELP